MGFSQRNEPRMIVLTVVPSATSFEIFLGMYRKLDVFLNVSSLLNCDTLRKETFLMSSRDPWNEYLHRRQSIRPLTCLRKKGHGQGKLEDSMRS